MKWNKFEGLSDQRLQPAYPHVEHESEHGWVLVCTEEGDIEIACMVWEDHEEGEYFWSTPYGDEVYYVTHWMPLPEAPKV